MNLLFCTHAYSHIPRESFIFATDCLIGTSYIEYKGKVGGRGINNSFNFLFTGPTRPDDMDSTSEVERSVNVQSHTKPYKLTKDFKVPYIANENVRLYYHSLNKRHHVS